jgi:hypothetical protein
MFLNDLIGGIPIWLVDSMEYPSKKMDDFVVPFMESQKTVKRERFPKTTLSLAVFGLVCFPDIKGIVNKTHRLDLTREHDGNWWYIGY